MKTAMENPAGAAYEKGESDAEHGAPPNDERRPVYLFITSATIYCMRSRRPAQDTVHARSAGAKKGINIHKIANFS